MTDYHINVFCWSDEDGGWVANIPDLQPCSAHGDDPAEAVQEVLIAKELWLEAARQQGNPIPEPRYRPEASAR